MIGLNHYNKKMGCYTSIYYIFIEIKVKFDQETSCVDTLFYYCFGVNFLSNL